MIGHHRALTFALALHATTTQITITSAAEVDPEDHQTFADDLTAVLYTNANECSSALGVSMAFSLVYPGCTNDAVDQVRETLGYPGGDNMKLVWEDQTQRMLDSAGGQCVGGEWDGVCNSEAPLLKIANSIWFDDGDTLNEEYNEVVGDYAKQIDLAADDSPVIVNEWVKNSTNGMIESIVDNSKPLYPPWELIAINSIYLKASWKHKFQELRTNLDSFYGSTSRTAQVSKAHFMNGVFDTLPYSHGALPGYQVVQLPFTNSQMSMIFVLPMSDGVVQKPVRTSELLPALTDLESTHVALSIPKFKFESTYDDSLKAAIIQTGIVAPFSGGSLCGLFGADDNDCESLFIDKVIQKTVIDVNEIGVEAAAVTAIMVGRTSVGLPMGDPILMVLDHPFQFFIYDKSQDLVLFEGRLGAPEIPETEPTKPLLQSVHSDRDFWSKSFYVNPVHPPASMVEPIATDLSSTKGFVSAKICFTLIIGAILGFALGLLLEG